MTTTSNITAIRKFNVTPHGIELNDFEQLHSQQGLRATYQALCFGGVQSLLTRTTNYAKMSSLCNRMKKEGREHEAVTLETSDRYLKAKEGAEQAATRLAVIHAKAEQSFAIELDFTPQMQRTSSTAELTKKAEFAGVDVSHVQAIEMRNALKRFEDADSAKSLAEALFYGADTQGFVEETKDENGYVDGEITHDIAVFIRPEQVSKALIRTRDYLLGWSTPDWAELGLLKADIEAIDKAQSKFDELTENSGEASRQMDEMAASGADLKAGNAA